MAKDEKPLEEAIKEVLSDAPKIKRYSKKELGKASIPWPFHRCHLELADYYSTNPNTRIGSLPEGLQKLMKRNSYQ